MKWVRCCACFAVQRYAWAPKILCVHAPDGCISCITAQRNQGVNPINVAHICNAITANKGHVNLNHQVHSLTTWVKVMSFKMSNGVSFVITSGPMSGLKPSGSILDFVCPEVPNGEMLLGAPNGLSGPNGLSLLVDLKGLDAAAGGGAVRKVSTM